MLKKWNVFLLLFPPEVGGSFPPTLSPPPLLHPPMDLTRTYHSQLLHGLQSTPVEAPHPRPPLCFTLQTVTGGAQCLEQDSSGSHIPTLEIKSFG